MMRRNRLAFAAAGAVLAALLLGLMLAFWQLRRALHAERTKRQNAYVAEMSVAFGALAEGDLGRARNLLNRQRPGPHEDDLRGFEWRHLWSLCQSDELCSFDDEGARVAAFSADGKLMAYAAEIIVVRDAASRALIARLSSSAIGLSFAPFTNLLASGNESSVTLWNTQTWTAARSLPGASGPCLFSPDGQWLLTGIAGKYRVWNTTTWQPLGDCDGAPPLSFQSRHEVAFSPDSRLLITAAGEGFGDHLRVWRLPSLERLADIRIRDMEPGSVAFFHDGKRLLFGLRTGQLAVHHFEGRTELLTPPVHTAWVTCISFAPDGRTFVTSSSDRTVGIWDAATCTNVALLRGHVGEALCAVISPDIRRFSPAVPMDAPGIPAFDQALATGTTRRIAAD